VFHVERYRPPGRAAETPQGRRAEVGRLAGAGEVYFPPVDECDDARPARGPDRRERFQLPSAWVTEAVTVFHVERYRPPGRAAETPQVEGCESEGDGTGEPYFAPVGECGDARSDRGSDRRRGFQLSSAWATEVSVFHVGSIGPRAARVGAFRSLGRGAGMAELSRSEDVCPADSKSGLRHAVGSCDLDGLESLCRSSPRSPSKHVPPRAPPSPSPLRPAPQATREWCASARKPGRPTVARCTSEPSRHTRSSAHTRGVPPSLRLDEVRRTPATAATASTGRSCRHLSKSSARVICVAPAAR
jgi:hypothetical protein